MRHRVILWILASLATSACNDHAPRSERKPEAAPSATSGTTTHAATAESSTAAAPQTDFRFQFIAAAKTIEPSVVSVKSTSEVQQPGIEGTPFEFFFRGQAVPHPGPMLRRGIGSGVIVDETAHVLTNNHVVKGADKVQVVLSNGHEFAAKVVGTDAKTDLAVLELEQLNEPVSPAHLGNSGELQVGEWVIAAGSPFGLQRTVSAGIVSALGRGNVGISDYEDFIQTDAAVNPGNSGGPLVNLAGRVVGINTAIASSSGGNNGVGFAIPIDMAKNISGQLIKTGKVVRGSVGLYIADVSQKLAASFGFKGTGGVLVQDVASGGPGAKAGLRAGDIIFEHEGKPVLSSTAFRNSIAASAPGSETTLRVWRENNETTVQVKLGELPDSASARRDGDADQGRAHWGLALVDPTPLQRQQLQLGQQQGGLIAQVEPESPADDAGLRSGDLIIEINGKQVRSAQDVQKMLSAAQADNLRLRVVREGHGLFVVLSS